MNWNLNLKEDREIVIKGFSTNNNNILYDFHSGKPKNVNKKI